MNGRFPFGQRPPATPAHVSSAELRRGDSTHEASRLEQPTLTDIVREAATLRPPSPSPEALFEGMGLYWARMSPERQRLVAELVAMVSQIDLDDVVVIHDIADRFVRYTRRGDL